jgi:drug/metabolite transporter (DMT)-like permease
MAFLAFVLSTRVLPLPTAEAIRGSYLIVAVLLGHAVFGTRPRWEETAGVLVALTGLAVFVGGGGERGRDEPVSGTALVMALVLVGVVVLAVVTARSALQAGGAGAVEAVLGGVAFAVLDMGVRSLPDPLSLSALLGQGTMWEVQVP